MFGGPEGRRWFSFVLVLVAAALGLALQLDQAQRLSATYDEPTYLQVASRWWRTGHQIQISRMGSPLTFWKLQQAPVLAYLDLAGRHSMVDDPVEFERELLPLVRSASLWIWLVGLGATAWWSLALYGHRAMAFAAWLFVLSPNLLAHGALATMEMPLIAATALLVAFFWRFLVSGSQGWFVASAIMYGLAWSCKFTAILYPPILGLAWCLDRWREGSEPLTKLLPQVASGMISFLIIGTITNFAITAGAVLPMSPTHKDHPDLIQRFGPTWGRRLAILYETPVPQDWVGFAVQTRHQSSGGSSYLFGERRMTGWWYYYFIALVVKLPPTVLALFSARAVFDLVGKRKPPDSPGRHDVLIPFMIGSFLVVTAIASTRNYGVRYLLPLAPLAIVWISKFAELARWRWIAVPVGLIGGGVATFTIHPFELTYFNAIAGGPIEGRRILSDSNLDWGQGLLGLAEIQKGEEEFRDLTLYYFGDTIPSRYGVQGESWVVRAVGEHADLPKLDELRTRYVAVSASLVWGPWGPAGFFDRLRTITPVKMTDDTTIAIYRADDLR